jgi:polar amino acid transport system substrate-binding protein
LPRVESVARVPATLFAFVPVALACGLPRDAAGTLDRVTNGVVRVGYAIQSPWITDNGAVPGGIEAKLASDIAASVGARIVWIQRPEADLMHALHERELDLVISGLTQESAWSAEAAFTTSYYTDTIVVSAPRGSAAPSSVNNARVAILPGDPVAALIRKKNGVPVIRRDIGATQLPSAQHVWEVDQTGRESTGLILAESKRVLAVPPGENAWLVHVEKILSSRKDQIPMLLRASHR